jgi:SPP1 family predicted phage head-tail adaptor
MNPGHFRHRVGIQTYTEVLDPNGGQNGTWATTSTIWAAVQTLTGRKLELARQIDAEATVEIRTRYCGSGGSAQITIANRLLFGTRILEPIFIVNENERNIALKVICKEKIGELEDE